MAYTILVMDRVLSAHIGPIESVMYTAGDMQNGFVGVAGDLIDHDLREWKAPTTADSIHLLNNPAVRAEEFRRTDYALEKFFIPAGEAIRAYPLQRGDIYSVTYDGLTLKGSAPVKGNYVVVEDGKFKLKEVTKAELDGMANKPKFVGKLADLKNWGTSTVVGQNGVIARINKLVTIEVISN